MINIVTWGCGGDVVAMGAISSETTYASCRRIGVPILLIIITKSHLLLSKICKRFVVRPVVAFVGVNVGVALC